MPSPEHIMQPVERNPGALVENVYPIPGTQDMPDLQSQDTMGAYLMERFTPPDGPRTRLILTQTGRTWPRVHRPVTGWEEKHRWERNGWLISPKVAAGIYIGAALLSVAKPAALDTHDEVRQLDHSVYRIFNPVQPTETRVPHQVPVQGPVRHIRVNAEANNTPGSAVVDKHAVNRFSREVATVVKKGGKVVSVEITGRSSDEYGTNASIGRPETPAQDFADDRARAYASRLRQGAARGSGPAAQALGDARIHTTVDQNVLTPAEKRNIGQAAKNAGFTGPNNIIDVNRFFTAKRGVTLDASVTTPGVKTTETVYEQKTVPGLDNPPDDPNRDYNPWLIPIIPPIPRGRRVKDGIKPVRRFRLRPGKKIMTPTILKEDVDQVWLRIRPEAVQEDRTLVENGWAYTRKYEYLLRDDRIKDVLRADYKDKEDEDASLRMMFVDKAPAQETIAAFEELLTKFAAMENGKVGKRIGGIFVYLSDDAGTSHRDPKRVAMGIDKQSHRSILGTYTSSLNLVELHMPSTWEPEELEYIFQDFYGPRGVLAHEVGGHGTDDADIAQRVRRVWARGIPRAHVLEGDFRAHKMRPLHNLLRRLPEPGVRHETPIQFDILYRVPDLEGRMVTVPARVSEGDPRLTHAIQSTIVGHRPTRYSSESDTEHYAETANSLTTGIPVPYEEASVVVPTIPADNGEQASFATGYRPDARAQDLYRKSVGAEPGSYPITFADPPAVRISHVAAANDPLIRQHMERTRRLRTLQPAEMEAILARVSHQKRPEKE
jgi:hypothetical protein